MQFILYDFLILSLHYSYRPRVKIDILSNDVFRQMTMDPAGPQKREFLDNAKRNAIGCYVVLLVLGLFTVCAYVLRLTRLEISFLYLMVVVAVALMFGFWLATLSSVVAVTCLRYLFVNTGVSGFSFDAEGVIALAAFEVTALIITNLSAREQHQQQEAIVHRNAVAKLYEISMEMMLIDPLLTLGPQIVAVIQKTMHADTVAMYDAKIGKVDSVGQNVEEVERLARGAYLKDLNHDQREQQISVRVLRSGGKSIGAMAVQGNLDPLTSNILSLFVESSLERVRSYQSERRAQAVQKNEELRTSVLDSLAHAFKTPLTTIRTASSGLVEMGGLNDSQMKLASLIEEQALQMNQLADRLLQTARLEVETLEPKKSDIVIASLIDHVLQDYSSQLVDYAVEVSIVPPSLATQADRELLTNIIGQFVDNATKYSYLGFPINIAAEEASTEILISVHNRGPVIKMEDRELIFERFYRCVDSKSLASGTGVGLSVAKKSAEALGGHVWVTSDNEDGTTFFLSLPRVTRRLH